MQGEIKTTYQTDEQRDWKNREIHKRIDTNEDKIESLAISFGCLSVVVFVQLCVIFWLIIR